MDILNDLNQRIGDLDREIAVITEVLREEKQKSFDAEATYNNSKGQTKKDAKVELDNLKTTIKRIAEGIKLKENERDELAKRRQQIENKTKNIAKGQGTQQNVESALQTLNANYIASESKWYCIYSNGIRYQPQVRVITNETMKDMILAETGWTETNELTIKEIAKSCNRIYRDVERSFLGQKPGVLNQLIELRKFWLQPVYDQQPHVAFDILVSNLVDGDPDYKDQIEKYIAYTYTKPEDIFAPNIDSAAKGGAGRDTFFRMLEIIFTEECCGEATRETFQGTHNGELWGKVLVKISEQNSKSIDHNQFKNLTGGHNFRLRRMGENAIQAPRTFRFVIMNNGYYGTIPITGKGRGSEDRRVEPIISLTSLSTRIAEILNLDQEDDREKIADMVQDWQNNVWQNETEIAKWLGYIIQKHKPQSISKLVPLHGKYYEQMFDRQKNAFNRFMDIVVGLSQATNCFDVAQLHKIYEISTCQKIDKTSFGKRMCQWFIDRTGLEWETRLKDIYLNSNLDKHKRTKRTVVVPKGDRKMGRPEVESDDDQRLIFDIFEYIEEDKQDDKGKDLDDKPHANNIRAELL
jgi:hypothetical protein